MPKSLNNLGIVSLPLILTFAVLAGLTVFAASRSYMSPEKETASPSPSVIFTPSPSPLQSPSPSLIPCQTFVDNCPAGYICRESNPCDGPNCGTTGSGAGYCQPLPSSTPSPSPSPTPTPTPKPSVTPLPSATPKPSTAPAAATGGGNIQTERGSFNARVVTLPISAQMITDTANDNDCAGDCPKKPLADYVSHFGGSAGIVGTYTCPADYADCSSKKDSFDFSVYNSRLNKWINEGNLGWGGRSMIYQENGGKYVYRQNAGHAGGIRAGIVNYPGILNDGQITVEGGSLSAKQGSKGTKCGMGFNDSNIFLVCAYSVDMYDFAHVFKSLGAKYALNLDGGGSAALYQGGYKAGPGRQLPNAIVFK